MRDTKRPVEVSSPRCSLVYLMSPYRTKRWHRMASMFSVIDFGRNKQPVEAYEA